MSCSSHLFERHNSSCGHSEFIFRSCLILGFEDHFVDEAAEVDEGLVIRRGNIHDWS